MSRARQHKGTQRFPVVILVDVDGTLAGPYRQGRRELRPSAVQALAMLAEVAPVFLWSAVGADNPQRLLEEFPALRPHVKGCYGKLDFPLDTVDLAYAIDDQTLDDPVLACHRVGLCESYWGGAEDDEFLGLISAIVAEIRSSDSGADEAGEGSSPPHAPDV